ncbi:protein of unknown function [Streptococcus thermophilus]|nr:protein of unknown function [Streptococcus thermophilus]CAD0149879.1 protein of unknown function [Streptococcus thermophilus]
MQGILYALVPIFAWGAVGLVANKFGGDANQQTLGMTLGAFVFALIVFGSIISVVGKTTVGIIELFECTQKVP